MPKSLRKIKSQIEKKRGKSSTVLIEDSRDAKRLRKGMLRQERLAKKATTRSLALQSKVARFQHFQRLDKTQPDGYSVNEIVGHIEIFLSQFRDKIKDFEASRRTDRPRSSQEDRLRNFLERELDEFSTGYEIPDLLDVKNAKFLADWKGDTGGLSRIKTIRITKEGQLLGSS